MLATTVKRATQVERGRADRIGACGERTASRGQRGELSSACGDAGLLVITSVTMRVMDFYHHHEGLIRENWVPIDIVHILRQLDIDVFELIKEQ